MGSGVEMAVIAEKKLTPLVTYRLTNLLMFLLLHLIIFQLYTFCAVLGKVKTQPTD